MKFSVFLVSLGIVGSVAGWGFPISDRYDEERLHQRAHPYRNGVMKPSSNNPHKMMMMKLFEMENTAIRRGVEKVKQSTVPKCQEGAGNVHEVLPKSFDAREKWMFCPSLWEIRDHGSCSSWASVLSSVLTDRYCIASVKNRKLNDFEQFRFSEADLLGCAASEAPWVSDNNVEGCLGANIESVFDFLQINGTVSGGIYGSHLGCRPAELKPCDHTSQRSENACSMPNTIDPSESQCMQQCEPFYRVEYENDKTQIHSACRVQKRNNEAIQWEIFNNGPVLAVMRLYDSLYSHDPKTEGVYINDSEKLPLGINHAVKIIGWGQQTSDVGQLVSYWIVANAWNYNWGQGGFFKVYRGDGPSAIIKGADITGQVYAAQPRLNVPE